MLAPSRLFFPAKKRKEFPVWFLSVPVSLPLIPGAAQPPKSHRYPGGCNTADLRWMKNLTFDLGPIGPSPLAVEAVIHRV